MNKRLIKKRLKKQDSFNGIISTCGNNGGDILTIYDKQDGTLYIHSGHCCVTTMACIVPVEFLTALLSQIMFQNNNDINAIIDSFNWDSQFKNNLKTKVKKEGFWL